MSTAILRLRFISPHLLTSRCYTAAPSILHTHRLKSTNSHTTPGGSLLDHAQRTTSEVFHKGRQQAEKMADKTKQTAEELYEAAKAKVGDAEGEIDSLEDSLENGKRKVMSMGEEMVEEGKDAFGGLKSKAEDALHHGQEIVGRLYETTKQDAEDLVRKSQESSQDILNDAEEVGGGVVEKVKKGARKVYNKVMDTYDDVEDRLDVVQMKADEGVEKVENVIKHDYEVVKEKAGGTFDRIIGEQSSGQQNSNQQEPRRKKVSITDKVEHAYEGSVDDQDRTERYKAREEMWKNAGQVKGYGSGQ
ncbi:hypothetical protein HDV05_008776 [Chytridiales sp. JEL 0842]|nr:hypothetical protein HDV05_008776 [Chytridiales sp. JEL 0842]